jgi:hypothetical protein
VCQLSIEAACGNGGSCFGNQTCGADMQCRAPCGPTGSCLASQTCGPDNQCNDPNNPIDKMVLAVSGLLDAGSAEDGGGAGDATALSDAPFVPNPDAGSLGFTPTNFSLSGLDAGVMGDAGIWSGAPDAHITSNCTNCLPVMPVTIAQNDPSGTPADIYLLNSLTIDPSATLQLSGPRAVILAVNGPVAVEGLISVSGAGENFPGPGGFGTVANPGPGVGGQGYSPAYPNSQSGGASYCGVGGSGAASQAPKAPGGTVYGNTTLTPLLGGSVGGGPHAPCTFPGAGGGAIQITAHASITVGSVGAINAGGGGASCAAAAGSGGAILLEAPQVTILGSIAANGGGGSSTGATQGTGANATSNGQPAPGYGGIGGNGSAGTSVNGGDGLASTNDAGPLSYGSGGGGAGRIRINTASGSAMITGIVSPALSTPCATQGTLAR